MYKQLSFVDLLASVIQQVQRNTGLRCYDDIPRDAPKPFYFAEIIGSIPEPSKTMQKDRYQVRIHAFTDGGSSVDVLDAIQDLEEAMMEHLTLPNDYEVTLQIPNGLSQILNEEDGSKHAVLSYDFVIFSGYKMKI